jgi:GrpB-like predicted nucleotidyltransferase (UPF0157 family)
MGVYAKLNRPIHVVDYDPNWPALYETEKALIAAALGTSMIQIEHFGSTSVPGLAAKAVIDIAVGVKNLNLVRTFVPALEKLGYRYEPGYEQILPARLFLWKGTPLIHTHHLSLEVPGTPIWVEHFLFRDYLRRHPDEARHYGELKRELAARCVTDMEAYVRGKTDFVTACLEKAQSE